MSSVHELPVGDMKLFMSFSSGCGLGVEACVDGVPCMLSEESDW